MQPEPSWRPSYPIFDPETSPQFAAVHFWAEWNGYDVQMAKRPNATSDLFDHQLGLYSCDINRAANWALEIARDARVVNVPALALVVSVVPVDVSLGLPTEEALRERIGQWRERASSS